MRYISTGDPRKNLTLAEVRDYRAHGLSIHAVYEDASNAYIGGYAWGKRDALAAFQYARTLGYDPMRGDVIYFAPADVEPTASIVEQVLYYMNGVLTVLPLECVGIYGSLDVCNAVWRDALAMHVWQTHAWSKQLATPVDILQTGDQATIAGVTVDINTVLSDDSGAWGSDVTEQVLRQILSEMIPALVWQAHAPTDILPIRQLADMGHWLSNGLPDAIGLVGVNASDIRQDIVDLRTAIQELRTALGK